MLTQPRDLTRRYGAVLLVASLAGCAEDNATKPADSDRTRPTSAGESEEFSIDEAALRATVSQGLSACENIESACRDERGGGAGDAGVGVRQSGPSEECKTEIHDCLSAVVESALKFFAALHECQKTAVACVEEDGADRASCHADFDSCVKAAWEDDSEGPIGADGGADDDTTTPSPTLDGGQRDTDPRSGSSSASSGGSRGPVISLDAGVRAPISTGGGISSETCVTELEECTNRPNADPTACAEAAVDCVGEP